MARGQQSRGQRGGSSRGSGKGGMSESEAETAITKKLAESGERDRLREQAKFSQCSHTTLNIDVEQPFEQDSEEESDYGNSTSKSIRPNTNPGYVKFVSLSTPGEQLVERLASTGWRETVKKQVNDYVNDVGMDKARVEDIVQELAPRASSMVPDDVKRELLDQVQNTLDKDADF